jgi:hypothetical protein
MSVDQSQAEMSTADLDDLGARIPFGPRPNQTMPASWAASILTMLAERQPALFGGLMLEATTGYRATVKAAR